MDHNSRRHLSEKVTGNKRISVLVVAALIAGLLGFAGASTGAAQTTTVTFSGTVTVEGGASPANVMVSVATLCWQNPCQNQGLADIGAQRPRPLGPVAVVAEAQVNSAGGWTVSVSGFEPADLQYVVLVVWDPTGRLGSRLVDHQDYPGLRWWASQSGLDVELEAGGQVSGRFADETGSLPPAGDYALVQFAQRGTGTWFFELAVDPQTGEFTSPVVAPGTYNIAHGNHGGDYLNHNAAATVEVTAGQTADAGTIGLQRPGQITGKITDSSGQGLGGIWVGGAVSSQSSYWSMPGSPFARNGSTSFSATTADDGTYTGRSSRQRPVPGDWQLEFEIPAPPEITAIAAGEAHSCAIRAGQTIECWGRNRIGEADPPAGRYTAIATGWSYSCAIATDQTIDCWPYREGWVTDAPAGRYTAIAAYNAYICAIRADNQAVACWGDIYEPGSFRLFGQILSPEGRYTAIATGQYYACGIKTDQTVNCWDYRTPEGVFDNTPEDQYTAIAAGGLQPCAIRADNQAIDCWGTPRQWYEPPVGGQYIDIASGGGPHTCAIRANQTITCWGFNLSGEGNPPRGGQYIAIAAGSGRHSCAIRADQTITCWGDDEYGQTSAPTTNYSPYLAVEVSVSIASGHTIACSTVRIDTTYPPEATTTCSSTQADAEHDAGDGTEPEHDAGDGTEPEHDAGDGTEPEHDAGDGTEPEHDAGDGTEPEHDAGDGTEPEHDAGDGTEPEHDAGDGTEPEHDAGDGTEPEHDAGDGTEPEHDAGDGTEPEHDAGDGTEPEHESPAERCFAVHRFGAQSVDVAKSADRETVLAQLSWGYHDSIGCYLTLDEAALAALRAAPAPQGFPAGDPGAARQCSEIHKFGAQPVDVAKIAGSETVLAQVRWGFHESIGCFLALDAASTAVLRANAASTTTLPDADDTAETHEQPETTGPWIGVSAG